MGETFLHSDSKGILMGACLDALQLEAYQLILCVLTQKRPTLQADTVLMLSQQVLEVHSTCRILWVGREQAAGLAKPWAQSSRALFCS